MIESLFALTIFFDVPSPLIRLTPRAWSGMFALISGRMGGRNWCGTTKISKLAPREASARSGTATTFSGRDISGRYLTFSWRWLIMLDNFARVPLVWSVTISSWTHMFTLSSQNGSAVQLLPIILAMALPQFPLPMMHTLVWS